MSATDLVRKKITLIIIKLDYCQNTFGNSPCTAFGTQCYNTYFTCLDKPNFVKTSKEYRYINYDAPLSSIAALNALPLYKSTSFMSTELLEDKTIPARANVTFMDEKDYDETTDPYLLDRRADILSSNGTHFKKLIARNPFYKKRILERYEGYEGDSFEDLTLRFSGKIENITREGNTAIAECADDIADMSKKKFPIKTNAKLNEDLGAIYPAANEDEMIRLPVVDGDYALRKDFANIDLHATGPTNLDGDMNFFKLIAYNSRNVPIAMGQLIFNAVYPSGSVTLYWDAAPNATKYRIYGITSDFDHYYETTGLSYIHFEDNQLPNEGIVPTEAERVYQFSGTIPGDINNWVEVSTPLTIELDTTLANTTGYIIIEEEVIYYDGIVNKVLQNVLRIRNKSKGNGHYSGVYVSLVPWYVKQNPYDILSDLLLKVTTSLDTSTIGTLKAVYSGIDMGTAPLIKETDAEKLIFDLCYVLDLRLWVNEDGKVTVKYATDETVDNYITDAENIILNSKSIDYNTEDIKSRIYFYYGRNDFSKDADEKANYSNLHIEINADAEGANMYNEEIPDEITTTWINLDCDTAANITAYVSSLLNKKLKRSLYNRPSLSFEVDQKDEDIKVGNIVSLSSDAFNDIDGDDYQNKKAQVIAKEFRDTKIGLTVRILATETVTTTTQTIIQLYQNPKAITSFALNEVRATNLKLYDLNGDSFTANNLTQNLEAFGKIEFDNMYASNAETAVTITGLIKHLPQYIMQSGTYLTDTSGWKSVKNYNVYMFVASPGNIHPATSRPTINDANGTWYKIAVIKDLKNTDGTAKYSLNYKLPSWVLGCYISFDVYADANLVFDPNAPVGIEVDQIL